MANTVNFTGSVDRDLLRRAKVIAAKSDTSINALFNAELRYLVETFEASESTANQNFEAAIEGVELGTLTHGLGVDGRSFGIPLAFDLLGIAVGLGDDHFPLPVRITAMFFRALSRSRSSIWAFMM